MTRMSVPGCPVRFASTTRLDARRAATPPTIASGNDVIPPTSAAVSADSRRLGPSASLMSLAR